MVIGIIADPVGEERYPIPPTIPALTASYTILMGLVWLHERFSAEARLKATVGDSGKLC